MRKLHAYRIWFQTSEGERFYVDVEAMNPDMARKKAQLTIDAEEGLKAIGGKKKEWIPAFLQEMDQNKEKEGQHVIMFQPGAQVPVVRHAKS